MSLLWISAPYRLIDPHPCTDGVQSGILPFSFALLNTLRQYSTGQKRESPAVRCLNILFIAR